MDMNQLYCFREICRCGSMAQAARNLYHSTQNLSRIVKALEEELGVVLFFRFSSGVELTESGLCLLDYAETILEQNNLLMKELKLIQENHLGEVSLLSAFGVLRLVKPESILEFQRENPSIPLRYREGPDCEIEKLFDQKNGNVAFSIAPFEKGKYDVTPLATFPISMIVHKDHPMAKKDYVYLEDLMENDVYLESDAFKIHHIIKDACNRRGFQPDIVFQTSGFSLCRSVVSRGSGISVVVDDIYHEMQAPNVVKIPFHPDEDLHWDVCMITRSGEVVNESVQIFQKFVKKRLLLE